MMNDVRARSVRCGSVLHAREGCRITFVQFVREANVTTAKLSDWRERGRIVASTVIVVILVAFIFDNTQSVRVGFIVTEQQAPLIWVLLVTALLAGTAGYLLCWRRPH
jgi:uncharacterized integral membrane protein